MKRLFKFGMLLIIVLLVGLICFTVSAQEANATTYAQDKAGAIQAANVAIDRIYIPVAYEQAFVDDVAYARALVTHAKTKGAVDADFTGLTKLANAENEVKKFAAIQTARNAIDRIPPTAEITSADRGTITEARRLVAANLSGTLSETALPATGAVDAAALVGTLLAGTGALIGIKMRRKHIKTK